MQCMGRTVPRLRCFMHTREAWNAHPCMYSTARTQPLCDLGLLTSRVETGAALMTTLHACNALKFPRGSACKYTASTLLAKLVELVTVGMKSLFGSRHFIQRPAFTFLPCCFVA